MRSEGTSPRFDQNGRGEGRAAARDPLAPTPAWVSSLRQLQTSWSIGIWPGADDGPYAPIQAIGQLDGRVP